jgi:hypothetical protein
MRDDTRHATGQQAAAKPVTFQGILGTVGIDDGRCGVAREARRLIAELHALHHRNRGLADSRGGAGRCGRSRMPALPVVMTRMGQDGRRHGAGQGRDQHHGYEPHDLPVETHGETDTPVLGSVER